MHHFSRLLAVCVALWVAACGGGGAGGNAGTPLLGGAVADLFTSAPADLTLEAGGTKPSTFVIGGGRRPYTVASSNAGVVLPAQNGDNGFILTGVKPGTATVVVKDTSGQSVAIVVTARPTKDLSITVPGSLSLSMGEKQLFAASGGAEPFVAVSGNPSVAQVLKLSATDFTISALKAGTTQITVIDSNGSRSSVDLAVSPGTPLYSTAPLSLSLYVDITQPYKLGGGVPPYVVRSSNPGVLEVGLADNGVDLTVKGLAVGTSSVVVTDAAGTAATVSAVNVTPAQQLVAIVPDPVVLRAPLSGQSPASFSYPIAGGKSPFVARSSDEAVARVSVELSSNGPHLSVVPLAAGTARLMLTDALGSQFFADLSVASAAVVPLAVTPGTATAVVGDVLTFTVSGGVPDSAGLYTVRSNNPSVLTVPSTAGSSFSAALISAGATVLSVLDSQGQVITATVDVSPANTALRLSPVSISIKESTTPLNVLVSVVGGSNASGASIPVRVFSSDVARISASATADGNIRLSLPSDGKLCFKPGEDTASSSITTLPVTITAVDDLGSSATMTVKILDEGGTAVCPN